VRPNGNQLEEAASKGSERREARRDQETEKLGEYLLYLTREPGVLLLYCLYSQFVAKW